MNLQVSLKTLLLILFSGLFTVILIYIILLLKNFYAISKSFHHILQKQEQNIQHTLDYVTSATGRAQKLLQDHSTFVGVITSVLEAFYTVKKALSEFSFSSKKMKNL